MTFSWMKNLARRQSSRARGTTRGKRYPGRVPLTLELLEDRIAPSVSAKLNHNVLSVQGTAAGDVIGLRLKVGDPTRLEVLDHGIPIASSSFSTSTFTQISVEAKAGNDTLVI